MRFPLTCRDISYHEFGGRWLCWHNGSESIIRAGRSKYDRTLWRSGKFTLCRRPRYRRARQSDTVLMLACCQCIAALTGRPMGPLLLVLDCRYGNVCTLQPQLHASTKREITTLFRGFEDNDTTGTSFPTPSPTRQSSRRGVACQVSLSF